MIFDFLSLNLFYQLILPGPSGQEVEVPYPSGFEFAGQKANLGAVISDVLKYIYPAAGIIFFFILIAGGFQLLTAAGNEETIKKAQQKITYGLVGFLIIFVSFWLIKIIEAVLGVSIFPAQPSTSPSPTPPTGPFHEEF